MKIAFVGKGGSGKTTMAALFARRAVNVGRSVLAIDADINQHLAAALGMPAERLPVLPMLGERLPWIKEYLRGDNPRIASADAMLKTTPPGRGSRLIRLTADDVLLGEVTTPVAGLRLGVTGGFAETDLGVACYHSKVGAVELMLNHLVDGGGEYVVVDMVAGAEAFASGMFTRFDRTFLVCEPTVRSVGVYHQYAGYAADYRVPISVIGNKIDEPGDVDFLREHVGDALFGWCSRSSYVKSAERGDVAPIETLESDNLAVVDAARRLVDETEKDLVKFTEQARLFHRRNAEAWGNDRSGTDLIGQIDPEFVMPAAQDLSSLVG
ncbi:CO dehydrogenase maturation factor [Stackebrandtia endophytica]|uniref:CO dehydrogenase maturation factor n=1 Tax=Stackebrandtia endophytica TaxID=1496996 RepID=A0A543B2Q7_9ACTN|nr:ATP-binding protein [Stackebrandtia endophytica]TQL79109.1 CO dehydrogenase maturation factor [Stackebrandtia endophytica]